MELNQPCSTSSSDFGIWKTFIMVTRVRILPLSTLNERPETSEGSFGRGEKDANVRFQKLVLLLSAEDSKGYSNTSNSFFQVLLELNVRNHLHSYQHGDKRVCDAFVNMSGYNSVKLVYINIDKVRCLKKVSLTG